MKSRGVRWAGHVTLTGDLRNSFLISLNERNHSEDLDVDVRIILKLLLGK